jgi:hypothetical protein
MDPETATASHCFANNPNDDHRRPMTHNRQLISPRLNPRRALICALIAIALIALAACAPNAADFPPTSERESLLRPSATPAARVEGVAAGGVNRTVKPTNLPPPTPDIIYPVSAVEYPAGYRETFVHYATVDRGDGFTRDLYISPAALDAYARTGTLPDDTVVVIEAYLAAVGPDGQYAVDAAGHYVKGEFQPGVHVMHKRADWTPDDFISEVRAGQWNFGSFDGRTGERFSEDTLRCINCHNAMPGGRDGGDFLYSRALLDRYLRRALIQYMYCDLPDRIPCP